MSEKFGVTLELGRLYLCKNTAFLTNKEYSFLEDCLPVHVGKSFYIFVLDVSNYLPDFKFYKVLSAGEIIENFYVSPVSKGYIQEVK